MHGFQIYELLLERWPRPVEKKSLVVDDSQKLREIEHLRDTVVIGPVELKESKLWPGSTELVEKIIHETFALIEYLDSLPADFSVLEQLCLTMKCSDLRWRLGASQVLRKFVSRWSCTCSLLGDILSKLVHELISVLDLGEQNFLVMGPVLESLGILLAKQTFCRCEKKNRTSSGSKGIQSWGNALVYFYGTRFQTYLDLEGEDSPSFLCSFLKFSRDLIAFHKKMTLNIGIPIYISLVGRNSTKTSTKKYDLISRICQIPLKVIGSSYYNEVMQLTTEVLRVALSNQVNEYRRFSSEVINSLQYCIIRSFETGNLSGKIIWIEDKRIQTAGPHARKTKTKTKTKQAIKNKTTWEIPRNLLTKLLSDLPIASDENLVFSFGTNGTAGIHSDGEKKRRDIPLDAWIAFLCQLLANVCLSCNECNLSISLLTKTIKMLLVDFVEAFSLIPRECSLKTKRELFVLIDAFQQGAIIILCKLVKTVKKTLIPWAKLIIDLYVTLMRTYCFNTHCFCDDNKVHGHGHENDTNRKVTTTSCNSKLRLLLYTSLDQFILCCGVSIVNTEFFSKKLCLDILRPMVDHLCLEKLILEPSVKNQLAILFCIKSALIAFGEILEPAVMDPIYVNLTSLLNSFLVPVRRNVDSHVSLLNPKVLVEIIDLATTAVFLVNSCCSSQNILFPKILWYFRCGLRSPVFSVACQCQKSLKVASIYVNPRHSPALIRKTNVYTEKKEETHPRSSIPKNENEITSSPVLRKSNGTAFDSTKEAVDVLTISEKSANSANSTNSAGTELSFSSSPSKQPKPSSFSPCNVFGNGNVLLSNNTDEILERSQDADISEIGKWKIEPPPAGEKVNSRFSEIQTVSFSSNSPEKKRKRNSKEESIIDGNGEIPRKIVAKDSDNVDPRVDCNRPDFESLPSLITSGGPDDDETSLSENDGDYDDILF